MFSYLFSIICEIPDIWRRVFPIILSDLGGLRLWPIYYMKSSFVEVNTFGSEIYHSTLSEDIDVLAAGDNDVYLTVVNKLDSEKEAVIKIGSKRVVDTETGITIMNKNGVVKIPMKPYEVRFFKVSN